MQTGEYIVRLPLRCWIDGAPRAAKQTSIFQEHVAIMHLRRPQLLGHRARFCASAHAEVHCDSNRTAQNWPSYQHVIARSVSLGAAWFGAIAPLFRDRIAERMVPVQGTGCAAIVFG
jgi:hypothetical protein